MSVELSHERLEKLREMAEYDLKTVPEGMQKPIAPEVMDKLIFMHLPKFDGKVMRNESGFSKEELLEKINKVLSWAKVPIWTGEFLSKVDMSEVSFEGAILDFFEIGEFFSKCEQILGVRFDDYEVRKYIEKIASYYHQLPSRGKLGPDSNGAMRVGEFMFGNDKIRYEDYEVITDFSNTNISFKPNELFITKREMYFWLDNYESMVKESNNSDYPPHIANCSFANADLGCKDWGHVYLENCDLTNTGVVIKIDTRKSKVVNGARSCELVGCVVNGKPVERKKIAPDKKEAILAELGDLTAQYMAAINVEAVPKGPKR